VVVSLAAAALSWAVAAVMSWSHHIEGWGMQIIFVLSTDDFTVQPHGDPTKWTP
jgi:hypothetical protein